MTGGPELEELPPQRVLPRGRGRPGATAVVALSAVAILLAGGFGLLGGRPGPSPIGTWTTNASNSSPLTAAKPTAGGLEPAVTPRMSCSSDPSEPPDLLFVVDGAIHSSRGPAIASGGAPVDVPGDAITEIWVSGNACAGAWRIDVNGVDLERRTEGGSSARQNGFEFLLPYSGRSDPDQLRARLSFPTLDVEASWFVQVGLFGPPVGELAPDQDRPAVAAWYGCDVTIRLGNGYGAGPDACGGSGIGQLPQLAPLPSGPSEPLVFSIPKWRLNDAALACGHLVPDPAVSGSSIFMFDSACQLSSELREGAVRLTAPTARGTWTVAMSGCATDRRNNVCGTWYANVEVRP